MKKIITMVGTSIFENYLEEKKNSGIRNFIEDIKDKTLSERGVYENELKEIERQLKEYINAKRKEEKLINISAELKSLSKLRELLGNDLEVYLLTSDTLLGKLAGEILEEVLKEKLHFEVKEPKVIKNLRVEDYNKFKNGLDNLLREVDNIASGYWDNVIINITGGFKAVIPHLTILAQINRCPIYYIFEDTEALIKIPYIPLDIRWEIFDKYYEFFYKLEKEDIVDIENLNIGNIDNKSLEDIRSLLEEAGNLYELNPLGIYLWEKYKQKNIMFNISEVFHEYIEEASNERKEIIHKSLLELHRRLKQNPNHPDLHHNLSGIDMGGFEVFKHKENNLQVRIAYKADGRKTNYGTIEYDIYIGYIAIGREVHNAENEYVEEFKENFDKFKDISKYKVYKLPREE